MKTYIPETELLEKNIKTHLRYLEMPVENITSIYPITITENVDTSDNYRHINNHYIYIKIRNSDLKNILEKIRQDNQQAKERLNKIDSKNQEIIYELKLVNKETTEITQEKEKLEEELSKFKHFESNSGYMTLSFDSTSVNHTEKNKLNGEKEIRKEKDKKVKELKNNLTKLEKGLIEAKKVYEEKKKKNDIFFKQNEHLAQNLRQKLLIVEKMNFEIDYMNSKIEQYKTSPNNRSNIIDDDKSIMSRSTNTSNNSQNKKKGLFGFVKSIFK